MRLLTDTDIEARVNANCISSKLRMCLQDLLTVRHDFPAVKAMELEDALCDAFNHSEKLAADIKADIKADIVNRTQAVHEQRIERGPK